MVRSHDFFNNDEWVDTTGEKAIETNTARGLFLRRYEDFLAGIADEDNPANYYKMDKLFKEELKKKRD